MKLSTRLCTIAIACSASAIAFAGDSGTMYLQGGTNGIGLGYAASVSNDWAVRGQYNTYKTSYSGSAGDFGAGSNLTLDLKFDSVQLLGDWYPSDGGFRVSGGVVFNNNKITIAGTGQVNNKPATVNAEIKLSDSGVAPYVGIGYSTRPKDAKGFGFNFDLGAMFQDPKAKLSATGVGVTQADIDAQQRKMQSDIDVLKVMPVLGLGVSYSF